MEQEDQDYFRALLNKQLEELLGEAGKTVSGMTNSKDDNFPDPTDRASLETDRNFLLRVKDRERKLILKVEEAISRLEGDEFGICVLCGEEISTERLKVRSVTTSCIDCKTEEEEDENKRKNL